MRIGEGGYNSYNPTAMAWEQMAGLAKQKPVEKTEPKAEKTEKTEASVEQGQERKVAKRRLGASVIQVSSAMMPAGEGRNHQEQAQEPKVGMAGGEPTAEPVDEKAKPETEAMTGTGHEELDAWAEKMQMPMEEYWDELMAEQDPQSAESFGGMPKLELFQEGARKFLRKNLPGLSEAALDERADLATRVALQKYATLKPRQWKQLQTDNARLPRMKQKSEKTLAKGFDERVMHEAFHDMRRSLESLYMGERALKPQNRPEEAMGEDEQIAWRAATEPRKPGTIDLLILRKQNPRREGETADGFFARLKRYTRQGIEREKQLEADEEYYAKQEELMAAEAAAEEATATETEEVEQKKPEKVVELAQERARLEEVGRRKDLSPEAQAREMEKIVATAEARVNGLADDDDYKLLAMREINEMRAQINRYNSVMTMVDGAVREAEALREQGITPVAVNGDMASDYNAEGALSRVDLVAQGIISDEMSDEEKYQKLNSALKGEMETAQKVEIEYRLAEQAKVEADRRYQDAEIQRNYHKDLIGKIQSALRYVKRAVRREAPGGAKVVQFPKRDESEAQEG